MFGVLPKEHQVPKFQRIWFGNLLPKVLSRKCTCFGENVYILCQEYKRKSEEPKGTECDATVFWPRLKKLHSLFHIKLQGYCEHFMLLYLIFVLFGFLFDMVSMREWFVSEILPCIDLMSSWLVRTEDKYWILKKIKIKQTF